MQFNSKAIDEKIKHLDEIKQYPDVLKKVLIRNIGPGYQITENQRFWCGGGGTSYTINTPQKKFFLKVKNRSVCVESKLE